MVEEDEGDGQVMSSYGSYPITISGRGYPAFCDDGQTRKTWVFYAHSRAVFTQIVGQNVICECPGGLTALSRMGMEKSAWLSRLAMNPGFIPLGGQSF